MQATEGEPESRRIAREKRLATKAAQIETARQEMQQRESKAASDKQQKVALRDQIKPRMDAWSKGKQVTIRTLQPFAPAYNATGGVCRRA